MQTYISHYTPVDITVGELSAGQDPSSTVARIAAVDGVEGVVPVPQLEVTMTGGRQKGQKEALTVSAVDAKKVSPVLRSRKALEALDDRVLLLDRTYDIADGTPVTLTGPAGSVDLTVRVKEGVDAAVTPAVAHRLVGTPTAMVRIQLLSPPSARQLRAAVSPSATPRRAASTSPIRYARSP